MKLLSHYRSAANRHFSNWHEYDINENMIYSHRSTQYNRETYPVGLHFHDYYELLIVEGGDVCYICESASYLPRYGDVILIPPGKLHMSMINAESTTYSRCVFYLYDNAFDAIGCSSLLQFLHRHESSGQFFTSLKPRRMEELTALLARLDMALEKEQPEDHALALGLILPIFYLLNKPADESTHHEEYFPQNVLDIQHYLDTHFAEVSTVAEVAEHFFYSREYVSRLFKKYLNTTVANYVLQRRIVYSQRLIETDMPLLDVCYQAGFGSTSSFIRAFQSVTGMTPSKYRHAHHERLKPSGG